MSEINEFQQAGRSALDEKKIDVEALHGLLNGYVAVTGRSDLPIESAAYLLLAIQQYKQERSEERRARERQAEYKAETGGVFALAELRYSAFARCPCGAGLAYPTAFSMHGWWDCAAILTGTADRAAKHTDKLPFAFYEVKSEDQPSANGATTRPVMTL